MSNTVYTFIRHAESSKNLKDITGGKGEKLTELGKKQVGELVERIKKIDCSRECQLFSSDIVQAKETACLLGNALNIESIVINELNPADMGVISGLSTDQILKNYPVIYNQLRRWKDKELEAVDLNIPGMEKPIDFYNRIVSFVKSIDNGKWNIIVCTRSLMVLIYNIVHNHLPYKGGGYKHQDIAHCNMVSFTRDGGKYSIIMSMTEKELV